VIKDRWSRKRDTQELEETLATGTPASGTYRRRCAALTCQHRRYKSLPDTPALAGGARENCRGKQGYVAFIQ